MTKGEKVIGKQSGIFYKKTVIAVTSQMFK